MKIIRQLLVAFITQSLLFAPIIHATELSLASTDITPPKIKHSPINAATLGGETVTITASVTDENGIKEVALFYREVGANQFSRLPMQPEMGSDSYAANLPAVQPPGIEYYIQATDSAGNSLLRGHSFSPLMVKVIQPAPMLLDTTPVRTEKEEGQAGISKWVWVGLGALAIGAIALAAGGDDEGGGNEDTESSTITISAPVPQ